MQGGFDLAARAALNMKHKTGESNVILAGLETLPWACRLIKPGSEVEVLGTKSEVEVAISGDDKSKEHALTLLQSILGHAPKLQMASSFLGVTLVCIFFCIRCTVMKNIITLCEREQLRPLANLVPCSLSD